MSTCSVDGPTSTSNSDSESSGGQVRACQCAERHEIGDRRSGIRVEVSLSAFSGMYAQRAGHLSVQLVEECGGWFGIRLRLLMARDRW